MHVAGIWRRLWPFYGDYISRVAQHDKEHGYIGEKHSPWSLSIEGRHEIFYGNMSVRVSLGYTSTDTWVINHVMD